MSVHLRRALFLILAGGVHGLLTACTYIVDSTADAPDANPGDFICARAVPEGDFTTGEDTGLCTLRAAIMEANATAIDERIEVPAGTYLLAPPIVAETALVISSNVLIRGAGVDSTIIDGGGNGCQEDFDRAVFRITDGNVGISGVTIQNGSQSGMQIDDGNVEIVDAILRNNFSKDVYGGAIGVRENASLTIRRSTLVGNCYMGGFGGAIYNEGELFVHDSLIADNIATVTGGGIYNSGLMNLRNTTVSGNYVSPPDLVAWEASGGIDQSGFAVLNNVTIMNNSGGTDPEDVGGIRTEDGATTVMKNSIVAGNESGGVGDDCLGELTSDSRYNLIGDSAGCEFTGITTTFLLDVDPLLAPLANNGGPTLTHALRLGSPAREASSPALPGSGADACEVLDQRGVPRPQGAGVCDMGAFESGNLNSFVTRFVLIDADTNQDLQSLRNGELLNLSQLPPNLSVRVDVSRTPGSVEFAIDRNISFHVDNVAPFALGGDKPVGDYIAVPLTPGMHTIRATPFGSVNGKGLGGGTLAVTFQVVQSQ